MAVGKVDNNIITLGVSGDEVKELVQVQGFHIPTGCTLGNSAGLEIGEGVSELSFSSPLQVNGVKYLSGTGVIFIYLA